MCYFPHSSLEKDKFDVYPNLVNKLLLLLLLPLYVQPGEVVVGPVTPAFATYMIEATGACGSVYYDITACVADFSCVTGVLVGRCV